MYFKWFWPYSVPENKDLLALQSLLSLMDMLSEILAVVRDLGPHVVDEEGLGEVIFVIRVWHRLEVEGHRSTALNVSNLEPACRGVAVGVEELGEGLAILGEERVIKTLFPLLIKVHHVVGLWGEERAQLLVAEDLVKNVDFIDGWLSTLISDPGSSDESSGDEMDLPQGCVSEHAP